MTYEICFGILLIHAKHYIHVMSYVAFVEKYRDIYCVSLVSLNIVRHDLVHPVLVWGLSESTFQ